MADFVLQKVYLREISLQYFIQKKSAAEAQRILVETCGNHALPETTYRNWFSRFKNRGFDVDDIERSGARKKFQNVE